MTDFFMTHRKAFERAGVIVLVVVIILALQAALFFRQVEPRMAAANAALFDLVVETAQRSLYRDIAAQINVMAKLAPEVEPGEPTLAAVMQEFQAHFSTSPLPAIETLEEALPGLTAGLSPNIADLDLLEGRLDRLRETYADHFKPLVDDLRRPPIYLWPTAPVIAARSGYRHSAMLNRAVYLAQIGDIGTARVMLAGLNARTDDLETLGTIYYALGRLQFELFRATPEVEYYTQSIQYLRQALAADPESRLAQRLLDFLLSLPQAAAAPQSAEGRPETPSEGEGAAVSAEKRIF